MYSQGQGSDNTTMYIVIAVLAILTLVGGLLYVFVFKCEDDGSECTTTSDCCEGLECIDSKCSSSTPTVSPQPVVVNNVEPELETCADWDVDNNCETGTILTSGTVIGNSQSECCRSLTCADWDVRNECEDGTTLTSGTVIGNSQGECCVSDVDCDGTWSSCTADCERTFTETTAQSGSGTDCPEEPLCDPGDGDCFTMTDSDGWFWSEDSIGDSCHTVCENNQKTCVDGDWGVHNEGDFREVFGDILSDTFCTTEFGASAGGVAPYVHDDRTCRYRNLSGPNGIPEGHSTCSSSGIWYRRLCKCV